MLEGRYGAFAQSRAGDVVDVACATMVGVDGRAATRAGGWVGIDWHSGFISCATKTERQTLRTKSLGGLEQKNKPFFLASRSTFLSLL